MRKPKGICFARSPTSGLVERDRYAPTVPDTVGAWFERWLRDEVEPNVARNTYAAWELAWRLHAKPLVTSQRLERFSPDDVSEVYAALRRKKLGGRSIQIVGQVMRSGFEAAIRHGKFLPANPWRAVPVPRHEAKEARAPNAPEAKRFIRAARGDRFEALWLLSLLGGCRLGECLGLTWEDVDFTTGRRQDPPAGDRGRWSGEDTGRSRRRAAGALSTSAETTVERVAAAPEDCWPRGPWLTIRFHNRYGRVHQPDQPPTPRVRSRLQEGGN